MKAPQYVSCSDVVEDGVCKLDRKFCPFYIRGVDYSSACIYRNPVEKIIVDKA